MYPYSQTEVVETFRAATNLNAAAKNFLKHETDRDRVAARFAKAARASLASGTEQAIQGFVERSLPEYERHLLVLARYAHQDAITEISSVVIETYADDFNATYERGNDGITLKDKKKFEDIAQNALKMIDDGLSQQSLPKTGFMKNVIIFGIFEDEVIRELTPLFR